jgi:transposase-like protein
VVDTVKTVLESALKEEVTEFLKTREKKPYRSGYYYRRVNTQYGQISDLAVPKLRATVYTQVESELVSIREEWTQSVAARVLK